MIISIYEEVLARGIQHSNHESDLYIYVNPETTALVDDYRFKGNVTRFTSETDGKMMFDIPFAYPVHEKRAESSRSPWER